MSFFLEIVPTRILFSCKKIIASCLEVFFFPKLAKLKFFKTKLNCYFCLFYFFFTLLRQKLFNVFLQVDGLVVLRVPRNGLTVRPDQKLLKVPGNVRSANGFPDDELWIGHQGLGVVFWQWQLWLQPFKHGMCLGAVYLNLEKKWFSLRGCNVRSENRFPDDELWIGHQGLCVVFWQWQLWLQQFKHGMCLGAVDLNLEKKRCSLRDCNVRAISCT